MHILILGGGRPQFSAVEACIELNYTFIVFDGNKDYFATKYLAKHQFMRVDISNTEKVLGAINSLSQSIDACITTQTDVAIQTQRLIKSSA